MLKTGDITTPVILKNASVFRKRMALQPVSEYMVCIIIYWYYYTLNSFQFPKVIKVTAQNQSQVNLNSYINFMDYNNYMFHKLPVIGSHTSSPINVFPMDSENSQEYP